MTTITGDDAIRHRLDRAARTASALLPALAAAMTLVPAVGHANDRDLRGTAIPAAACVEHNRSAGFGGVSWSPDGFYVVQGTGQGLALHCALPVNAIDLSGTTNDNDISRFRVHYKDPDGLGPANDIQVRFIKTSPASDGLKTYVCEWSANTAGTGSANVASATRTCAHDVANGSFYHFDIYMTGNDTRFYGIDFP